MEDTVTYRSLAMMQQGNKGLRLSPITNGLKGRSLQAIVGGEKKAAVVSSTKKQSIIASDSPLPMQMYPLSMNHVFLKDASQLDEAMDAICASLKGKMIPSFGKIEAQLQNNTFMRVSAIRDSQTGRVVIEFDRLDGCAFVFRWAFLKALLDAASYLQVDEDEIRIALDSSEKRLAFWTSGDNSCNSTSLVSLVSIVNVGA